MILASVRRKEELQLPCITRLIQIKHSVPSKGNNTEGESVLKIHKQFFALLRKVSAVHPNRIRTQILVPYRMYCLDNAIQVQTGLDSLIDIKIRETVIPRLFFKTNN